MGRVYLIEFEQTPETHFYLCFTCEAHIVLSQDIQGVFTVNELTGGLSPTVINVHTLSPEQDRKVGDRTVSDVYCNRCGNVLGMKFIEVANDDAAVRDGYFLLRRDKLKKWNGYEIV